MISEGPPVEENVSTRPDAGLKLLNELPRNAPEHQTAPAASSFAKTAEQVRKSLASIHREMSMLPTQVEQWRTAATEIRVNAALSTIPNIRSSMFRIAEAYQDMAHMVEQSYASYLKEHRIVCFGDRVFLCI